MKINFFNFLNKICSICNIIIGLLIIVVVNTIIFPYYAKSRFPVKIPLSKIPDLQFGVSKDFLTKTFILMQKQGREAYVNSTLYIDNIYALIYAFTYAILLLYLLKKNKKFLKYKFVVFFPFLISLFDLLENIGFISLARNYPNLSNNLIAFASISNKLKWIFAGITFIVLFLIIISNLMLKIRK